jgi:hypothetical protein
LREEAIAVASTFLGSAMFGSVGSVRSDSLGLSSLMLLVSADSFSVSGSVVVGREMYMLIACHV